MPKNSPADATESPARGFAQSGVRVVNERTILTLIAMHPGASNADLARLSGLGPQTTSRIVLDLVGRDLVIRGAPLRGRRGQPATPLHLNPEGAYTIGVELGWRHFEVLWMAMSGKVLASTRRSFAYPDVDTVFADIAAEVAALRKGMTTEQAERLVGIGIATPSTIDRSIVRMGGSPDLARRWEGVNIAEKLAAQTGLTVEWVNDGSAVCWSQWLALTAPYDRAVACLHVGTFIGAGITIGSTLWEGRTGNAANLGAIIVNDADGDLTTVHEVASIVALEARIGAAGLVQPTGDPLEWDWHALDVVLDDWIDDAGRALATAILGTRAIIELDVTVIDGVMPRPVIEKLVHRVRHHLARIAPEDVPEIVMGQLGGVAAALGAAQLLVFRRYFSRGWNLFAT